MKKLWISLAIGLGILRVSFAQNIVAGEYFWDTDPGIGLATALTAPEIASGVGDESFALNITTPNTAGQHVLFVRFKQNDTLWSQAYPQMLLVGPENLLAGSTNLVDSSKIVAIDYYWNDSTANVHTVTLATPTDQYISTANIPNSGLTAGQHVLNIRVKDKYGLYSPYSKELVFISPENHLAGATDLVDSLEMKEITYYWNSDTNPSQTIQLAPSDNNFNFTINFPTAGAQKGANQLFFRFKDKYGLLTPWQSESILVMGRQSGELAVVDSIRYALSGYSYGTSPNDFLNVTFNLADTLKRDSFDSNVVGSKEITTTGLSHGLHVMTFKVFGSTLLDSSIVGSKNSHFYQQMVKVDTSIKLNLGLPTLANGTVSTEYCPGGVLKLPIAKVGNWPETSTYGIPTIFTLKLQRQNYSSLIDLSTQINSSNDTLTAILPTDVPAEIGDSLWIESSFPYFFKKVPVSFKVGITAQIFSGNLNVCEKGTVFLNANTSVDANINWTGPDGFTASGAGTQRANLELSHAGEYAITATSTLAGCVTTATANLNVKPLPIISTSLSSPICEGQNLSFTSSSSNGGSLVSWQKILPSFSILSTNDANPVITNAVLADSGSYRVIYQLNNCAFSDTVMAKVKPNPTISNTSTNAPICSGENLVVSATATSGSTYSWTGPNSFTNSNAAWSISSATTAASGTYSLTVTLEGCTASTTVANVVNATPTASPTTPVVICENQTLQLNVNTTPSASYLWSGPFFASADHNPVVNASATTAMSGTYSVTVTLGSCSASNTVAVTVKPLPVLTSTSSNSPICAEQNLVVGIEASPGSSYAWTGPNGFTNSSDAWSISSATTAASGTYAVTITKDGCSINTTVITVVNPTPSVSTTTPVSICVGLPLQLNVNNTAGATYGWSGPNTFSSIAEDPLVSNNATLGMSGTYLVTVSLGTCSANGTVMVTVNPNPVLVITNQSAQQGGSVNLTLAAVTQGSTLPVGTNIAYFTDAGGTVSLPNANNITISGTYYIKATTSSNCTDIKPVIVSICGGIFDPITAPISSGTVSNVSAQKITAQNTISGTGTKATYRSALHIELKPGFKAENGTVFFAEIGGCN